MIDIDTLVGRLMDLESKYYDLQERYHHLINDYESLKEKYENYLEKGDLVEFVDCHSFPEDLIKATEQKLKAKNETDSSGHRNKSCTQCDSCVCDKGC